jgi:hypothetical protein
MLLVDAVIAALSIPVTGLPSATAQEVEAMRARRARASAQAGE